MAALGKYPQPLVFGLDIGTRSIVGTVGYQEVDGFHVVAQSIKMHESRAMLDGQIHDINTVAEEIAYVKAKLEGQIESELSEVCIAAAGRVLKTAISKVEHEFHEPTVVNLEYIHSLEMLGVEKAYEQIVEEIGTEEKYYCVGYTVIKYYMNGFEIGNLEGHKARVIAGDILATFLPEDVVDGLYTAVDLAGLSVANLTLEPIAAMHVAIPQNYRLLNIALVDVGAGTSDICITKDGSIIAYGMIPSAGDELTELIIKEYLVDFDTAEEIKMIGPGKKSMTYKDIMDIPHKITPEEVYELVSPVMEEITKSVADKIIELNGGKTVSAVFVVGGGGKLPGFTSFLAKHLSLIEERVALRGEEVMKNIYLHEPEMQKDPMFVTPIGICLNYYDHKNNFIFVLINHERIKLYNNDHLTVFDATRQFGIRNEDIFPKRGADLNYSVDGKNRFLRGHQGEAAVITVNEHEASFSSPIQANDRIIVKESTKGEDARLTLGQLPEFTNTITFVVNDTLVSCPKYASVNGNLESEFYQIQNNDQIQILNYYTLKQLLTFMDVHPNGTIWVNNEHADDDTKVYENFKVAWMNEPEYKEYIQKVNPEEDKPENENLEEEDSAEDGIIKEGVSGENVNAGEQKEDIQSAEGAAVSSGSSGEGSSSDAGNDKKASDTQTVANGKADNKTSESQASVDGKTETSAFELQNSKEGSAGAKGSDGGVSGDFENDKKVSEDKPSFASNDAAKSSGAAGTNMNAVGPKKLVVTANGKQYTLSGKDHFVFVEIFDLINFDTKTVKGTELVMMLNGNKAQHFDELKDGDNIEIYWRK